MPCCLESIGSPACLEMKRRRPMDFQERCRTDADFAMLQCCITCETDIAVISELFSTCFWRRSGTGGQSIFIAFFENRNRFLGRQVQFENLIRLGTYKARLRQHIDIFFQTSLFQSLGKELFASGKKSRHCFDRHNKKFCLQFLYQVCMFICLALSEFKMGMWSGNSVAQMSCNGKYNFTYRLCSINSPPS